jgi:ribosome-associated translation inhibitor RaiA
MQFRYHDLGVDQAKVQHVVEREIRVLERRLAGLPADLPQLDITIEHHQRSDSYTARLLLRVPDRDLVARGEGQNPAQALRDAFSDLYDAIERHLSKLHREDAIRRARQHPGTVKPPVPPEECG